MTTGSTTLETDNIDLAAEQARVPGVDSGDTAFTPTPAAAAEPGSTTTADTPAAADPVDPREAIAATSRERRVEELKTTAARIVTDEPVVETPAVVLSGDEPVRIKVLRQEYQMTRNERDAILKEAHGDDVVADWTEAERNKYAQMAVADAQYDRKWAEKKNDLRSTPATPAVAEPARAEPQAAVETIDEKEDRAYSMLQLGGDTAEVRALLKEVQDERLQQILDHRDTQQANARKSAGYDEADNRIMAEIDKRSPGFLANRSARNHLLAERAEVQRDAIYQYIGNSPARSQFEAQGWTEDFVSNMPPHEVSTRFKELVINGHQLPNLAEMTGLAIQRLIPGSTQPNPDPEAPGSTQPASAQPTGSTQPVRTQPTVTVDRSARKEQLAASPERTSLPRQNQRGALPPKAERDRARSAISEAIEARR